MAERITPRLLTLALIGVGAGINRPVFVYSGDAKRWGLHPGDRNHGEEHVTTDFQKAPEGTLFLHKCESGIAGYRIRSKFGSSGESDELYAPTADTMDRMLGAAKWAARMTALQQCQHTYIETDGTTTTCVSCGAKFAVESES